jgi:hypothetical protein
MLERYRWGHYPMGVRLLVALGCWLLGVAGVGLALVLHRPLETVGITSAVWFGLWLGVLQAACATGSRSLMRVFIWSTPSFVLVLLGLVLGLAVASE